MSSDVGALKTKYNADSTEFCPIEGCKVGALNLLDVDCKLLSIEETNAILDMKWCSSRVNDSIILACAMTDGYLKIYRITQQNPSSSSLSLTECISYMLAKDVTLLSLDWNNNTTTSRFSDLRMVVSTSLSKVHILQYLPTEITSVSEWCAHEYECWITAFDYQNTNIVYSGADDCYLKGWDIRNTNKPTFTKRFDAGVTSMQSHRRKENLLAVGSYDENVYLFDMRLTDRPLLRCKSSDVLGGGIWRVKWHPTYDNVMSIAAMRGGFHVLSLTDDLTNIRISDSYRVDCGESLAYGIDWCYSSSSPSLLATCSFYDRKCSVWNCELAQEVK